jgi:predicted metal-dependent peptidase
VWDEKHLKALEDQYQADLLFLTTVAPWLTLVLLKLKLTPTKKKIAAISRRRIFLNPIPYEISKEHKCYYEFDRVTRIAILLHELSHPLLFHLQRQTTRTNHKLANICQDVIVNRHFPSYLSLPFNLDKIPGIVKDLPDKTGFSFGGISYHFPDFLEKDWYELYDDLEANYPPDQFEDYDFDEIEDDDEEFTEAEEQEFDREITAILQNFSHKLPPIFTDSLHKLTRSKTNWKVLLRFLITTINGQNQYVYGNPRTQHIACLPKLIGNTTEDLVVAIDSSGSMSNEQIDKILTEVAQIKKVLNCGLWIIVCDARIASAKYYSPYEQVQWEKFEIGGRGGTAFEPVFNYLKEKKIKVKALVYGTDTYGSFPKQKPSYPVFWLTDVKDGKVPWGRLIKID